jgi:hypothetical protein
MFVVIIVMLFAKSLFVSSADSTAVKTGHLTSTEYTYVPTTTQEEVEITTTKKKKKKTTTEAEEETPTAENLPEGLDTSVAGTYSVNSAVYLHPEASASSENLLTVPTGAVVTVYGSSNYGWYYLEYDGQLGYAWGDYFTAQ